MSANYLSPIQGICRMQINKETIQRIFQDWWNAHHNGPPMQVTAVRLDQYGSGYIPVENITVELLPIDPLLQSGSNMVWPGSTRGGIGATGASAGVFIGHSVPPPAPTPTRP